MKDTPESSDTPTADAAEAFLNEGDSKTEDKPSHLKQAVLMLYKDSEQVVKTLQGAVSQNNPALDRKIMMEDFNLDLESDHNSHQDTLDAIKKGEISVTYWTNYAGGVPADPKQPTIRLEGQEVIGIWLRNTRIGSEINTGNFQVGHVFEIGLQSPDPKDPEWGALFHNFYISDQGDWLKSRSTEQVHETIENSEMTPYEFEITGMAIKILQKRLDQALSTTETPNR